MAFSVTSVLFTLYLFDQLITLLHPVSAVSAPRNPSLTSVQFLPNNPITSSSIQQQILQKAEQMRQNFAFLEQKLAMSSPQQQQFMISKRGFAV
jgi:hypothetical protein